MSQQSLQDDQLSGRSSVQTPGVIDKMRTDVQQHRQKLQVKSQDIETYRVMIQGLQVKMTESDRDFSAIQTDLQKIITLEGRADELTEEEVAHVKRKKQVEGMLNAARATHRATTKDLATSKKTMERMEQEYTTMHTEYGTKLRWTNEMMPNDADVTMTDLTATPTQQSMASAPTVANSVALKTGLAVKKAIPTEMVGDNFEVPTLDQQDMIYRTPQLIMKDVVAMLQFPVAMEVGINKN